MSKKWYGHYLSFCAFWALFLVIIDPIISVATNIYSHLMHTFPIWHMTTHPLLIWTESHTNSHFWKGPPYFTSAIVEMNALSNSICSRNAYMVWCGSGLGSHHGQAFQLASDKCPSTPSAHIYVLQQFATPRPKESKTHSPLVVGIAYSRTSSFEHSDFQRFLVPFAPPIMTPVVPSWLQCSVFRFNSNFGYTRARFVNVWVN